MGIGFAKSLFVTTALLGGVVACSSSTDVARAPVPGSDGGAGNAGGATSGGATSGGTASGGMPFNTGGVNGGCRTADDCYQPQCECCGALCRADGTCGVYTSPGCLPGSDGSGGASGGAGGVGGAGGGGRASPGSATIEFSVKGGPYCTTSTCGEEPSIEIEGVNLQRSCSELDCSTCQQNLVGAGCGASQCPPPRGIVVSGSSLVWDGSYFGSSTCMLGQARPSCVSPAFAPPGKYTARFCATPGTLDTPDGGTPRCIATGPMKCGTVPFDFPTTSTVGATLGP